LGTTRKFLLGFLLSFTGTIGSGAWLYGLINVNSSTMHIIVAATLFMSCIWAMYVTGRSWQILMADAETMYEETRI